MNRRVILLLLAAGLFLLGGAVLVQRRASQSIPLRFASIPDETKRALRAIGETGGDIVIRIVDEPVREGWTDATNEGEDAGNGFRKIENENFIVYFHPDSSGIQRGNDVLRFARECIPVLTRVFGRYVYPSDCNGRKLALYVCADRDEYSRLAGTNNNRSIALTSLLLSPTGAQCRGIYFAPETFSDDARSTVCHELAHFVYFSLLDLSKPLSPPMWLTEGVAEYASENRARLREIDPEAIIPLTEFETPKYRNLWIPESYWIGYTVFLHIEERYTPERLRIFVQSTYDQRVPAAVEFALDTPFSRFDAEWQESVSKYRR